MSIIQRVIQKLRKRSKEPKYVDTMFGRAKVFDMKDLFQEIVSAEHGALMMINRDTVIFVCKVEELKRDLEVSMRFARMPVDKGLMS